MTLNKKESIIHNETIYYLASKNALCPQYLGEHEQEKEVQEEVDGFFGMWFSGDKMMFGANIKRLSNVVSAVSNATKMPLDECEFTRVCESITSTVAKEYKNFTIGYGEDLAGLLSGNKSIH